MPDLIIDEADFEKTINILIHIFKKAAELQSECGNKSSENVYERIAVKTEYKQWWQVLENIKNVMVNHNYNGRYILKTALDAKRSSCNDDRTWIPELQEKLPGLPADWEAKVNNALEDIINKTVDEISLR